MIFRTIRNYETFYFKPTNGVYYTFSKRLSLYKVKSFPRWDHKKHLDSGVNTILAPSVLGEWYE